MGQVLGVVNALCTRKKKALMNEWKADCYKKKKKKSSVYDFSFVCTSESSITCWIFELHMIDISPNN